MGNTYKRHRSDVEEEFAGKRQGKVSKHSNNRKTHGMQTLNNYDIDRDKPIHQNFIEEFEELIYQ